jgi:hypothetical protein
LLRFGVHEISPIELSLGEIGALPNLVLHQAVLSSNYPVRNSLLDDFKMFGFATPVTSLVGPPEEHVSMGNRTLCFWAVWSLALTAVHF